VGVLGLVAALHALQVFGQRLGPGGWRLGPTSASGFAGSLACGCCS
jgi:hypothetical protein